MNLNISAVGMVSALGLDWETSCAASRAGISQSAAINYYRVQAGDPWEVQFVTAHQATLLTQGFEGDGRLLRLLGGAFADLRRRAPANVGELPVFLSLPGPSGATLDDDAVEDDTGEPSPARTTDERADDLLNRAAQLGKWQGRVRLAGVSTAGHTGFAEALQSCFSALTDQGLDSALVGAVDSLLDDETLGSLNDAKRLKHPAAPTGLVPGEAAVIFSVSRASIREQDVLCTVNALDFADQDQHFESDNAPNGKGLSAAIIQVAQREKWPGSDSPWILSDHNGEGYRAGDWGHTVHRLVGQDPAFAETHISFPAVSFGDTRAASGSVAAACAVAAWKRGYAPAARCCIVSSSDAGRRAAFLVGRPN